MKTKMLPFLLCCVCVISCSKSSEDQLNPPPVITCDTVAMKYSTNILSIIDNNCYSCHGNGQSRAGISLDSYAKLKALADNGKLVGVITHSPGYIPMPSGRAKLADCDINKIRSWVNAGAPNN